MKKKAQFTQDSHELVNLCLVGILMSGYYLALDMVLGTPTRMGIYPPVVIVFKLYGYVFYFFEFVHLWPRSGFWDKIIVSELWKV